MPILKRGELLIPRQAYLDRWPVIACDQFTSQREYWEQTARLTAGVPSSYHIIFPEAELCGDEDARIAAIRRNMEDYLSRGVFLSLPDSYVLVERTLRDGSIRRGVVCLLDLESYDFGEKPSSPVRATERTVLSRIPPRVRIRSNAALESSHVLLLCSDPAHRLIESAEKGEKLYELELMQGGGHLAGFRVCGAAADRFDAALASYEKAAGGFCYAVGDGNHSLAAAKACWEALRESEPALAGSDHPARYAMVELENLFDPAQRFEPIHRLVRNVDKEKLLAALRVRSAGDGEIVEWAAEGESGTLRFTRGLLPVGELQNALDEYCAREGGEIDYIHGRETAVELARREGAIAFLLPAIEKDGLFRSIEQGGVLPRKTFSMGHAEEKRYYLECRAIR